MEELRAAKIKELSWDDIMGMFRKKKKKRYKLWLPIYLPGKNQESVYLN